MWLLVSVSAGFCGSDFKGLKIPKQAGIFIYVFILFLQELEMLMLPIKDFLFFCRPSKHWCFPFCRMAR